MTGWVASPEGFAAWEDAQHAFNAAADEWAQDRAEIDAQQAEQDAERAAEMEDWAPVEPLRNGACNDGQVHESHDYRAIDTNYYHCAGLTQADLDAEAVEAARPPCVHGMSASLCADPITHYPSDREF